MQPVDVTGLSEKEIDDLDTNPVSMSVDKNGIAHPSKDVVKYKKNAYSENLVKNWPNAVIVQKNGKVKLDARKLPWDEQLKRMVRRKGDSRMNWMAQCSVKKCLTILDRLPGTDYKLATKKELTRQLNKFCGVQPKKSHKQKQKDKAKKEEKKLKKRLNNVIEDTCDNKN